MAEVPVIYIAGPIRAKTKWHQEQNVRRAEDLALQVMAMGAAVICPHSMGRFWDDYFSHDEYMERDFALLSRCDAVVMVDGWEESEGSKLEHALAHRLALPVFTQNTLTVLAAWIDARRRLEQLNK